MFDLTMETIKRTQIKLKKSALVVEIFVQIFYMAYLVYAIATQRGLVVANCILLAICLGYFLFYVATYKFKLSKDEKKQRKKIKFLVKWLKRIIKLVVIGFSTYELVVFTEDRTITAIVLYIFMILSFLLTIVFDLIVLAISSELGLIFGAIKRDGETLAKVINKLFKTSIDTSVEDKKINDKLDEIQSYVDANKVVKKKRFLKKKKENAKQ